MGNLDDDTRLMGGEGLYTTRLSPDWKIWGPNGGYVAEIDGLAHDASSAPAGIGR
jgi:hypothetical protein